MRRYSANSTSVLKPFRDLSSSELMAIIHEQISEQFFKWEQRGRGWQVFPEPVFPEPPFVPFPGHFLPDGPAVDDGRLPTLASSFLRKMSRILSTRPSEPSVIQQDEPEPEPGPEALVRDDLVELQTSLPADLNIPTDAFEHFLLSLSLCHEPIALELLGLPESIIVQFA